MSFQLLLLIPLPHLELCFTVYFDLIDICCKKPGYFPRDTLAYLLYFISY
uniref:Uncharacterized protein n=2 Tax=Picea TaxID=3328 RepID=A0A101M5G9_PICGL|nr:hypothetical protein ABT39_MTgene1299 [Picea glauca]QHR91620.1 hypothetical protein Q903MT_gene5655 [Picea sitchensis]